MKGDAILRTVWTQDAADVALLETTRGKIVGHDADRVGELFVSKRASGWTVDQRGLVGELLRAVHYERRERGFRDRDIRIGAFDYHVWLQIFGIYRIFGI